MRKDTVHPLASRAALWGVVLGLWWLLAGCAADGAAQRTWGAPEGPGYRGSPTTGRQPRVLRAMGDGPAGSGESTGQVVQGYTVPGRNPNSQAPWQLFLGNAAHRLIAYMYKVEHPERTVYFNTKTLADILSGGSGDPSRLLPHERNLRPDITDTSVMCLSEIKPWGDRGLQEGRQEVQAYLAAANRATIAGLSFTGCPDFHGQILIRFAQGQYIWRLEWHTQEPGVTLYRWTRSQQRFESERAAYQAGQWVELTVEEMRQYSGWVGQAVEGMVARREQLAAFSEAVGIVIDVAGTTAMGIFSGVIFGRMGAGSGTQQPPTQGGGQVIPFPARLPPPSPPAQVPAAVGM